MNKYFSQIFADGSQISANFFLRASARNKRKYVRGVAIFLFSQLVLSCATTKPPVREEVTDRVPEKKIETVLRARSDSIVSFIATGTMHYSTRKESGSVDVTLMHRHDSLRVDVGGPFGIALGKLLATKKYFLYYNSLEGEAYEGDVDAIAQLLPFEIPAPGLLGDMLFATVPPDAHLVREFRDSAQRSILCFERDSEKIWYRADPLTGRIENVSLGPNKVEIRYSDFRSPSELPFHSVFRMREAEVEFRFDDVILNPAQVKMELMLPASVPRRTIRQ